MLELRTEENAFVVTAAIGLGGLTAGIRVPHGSSSSSQASFTVRRDDAVVVNDYETETRFERGAVLKKWGVRSAVSVKIPGGRGRRDVPHLRRPPARRCVRA